MSEPTVLNFIMTGKDPDILHPCDFTTVIVRATKYQPDLRFANILEFEQPYTTIKTLLSPNAKSENKGALFTSVNDDGIATYNWQDFHRFSIKGNYKSHVYYDYIKVVVTTLSDKENLNSYYAAIGGAIDEFLSVFLDRLHICYDATGWPFSAMTSFGELFRNIYYAISEQRAKVLCLKEIWFIGYQLDQWSVQVIMNNLLNDSAIPREIQVEFAMVILESSVKVDIDKFSKLRIPDIIKQAILQKT